MQTRDACNGMVNAMTRIKKSFCSRVIAEMTKLLCERKCQMQIMLRAISNQCIFLKRLNFFGNTTQL